MSWKNKDLHLKMKILVALPFAPVNLVLYYFEVIPDDIPAELEPLYSYFEDNYFERPEKKRIATRT